jgi:putative spermidine/putrescine transport system permease protein
VGLAFVHPYTLFMVIPIFNSMMRIDRALLAAAADCRASDLQVVKEASIPLSKPGMVIGSIFVGTLVTGDFVTVRLMSGGQSASVGLMMNQISLLQYPATAANAVMLLIVMLLIVSAMDPPRGNP